MSRAEGIIFSGWERELEVSLIQYFWLYLAMIIIGNYLILKFIFKKDLKDQFRLIIDNWYFAIIPIILLKFPYNTGDFLTPSSVPIYIFYIIILLGLPSIPILYISFVFLDINIGSDVLAVASALLTIIGFALIFQAMITSAVIGYYLKKKKILNRWFK